jgi:hypothetical protein
MMWFNRADPRAVFGDIRSETVTVTDRSHREDGTRTLTVSPDRVMDFRALPFANGQFKLVVFDPPHLERAGPRSWLRAKYGALEAATWRDDLRQGFAECFRVLADDGVLIFKWNETQILVRDILALTNQKPLFGHQSGKRSATQWICFMKSTVNGDEA